MATMISRRRLSRLTVLPVLAILLAMSFAVGLGFSATRANGNDAVEACVSKYSGAVRMSKSDAPLNCKGHEYKRSWPGTDRVGLSDMYIVESEQTFNQQSFELAAQCPDDRYVTSAGVKFSNSAYRLVNSYPDRPNKRWVASAVAIGAPTPVTFTVIAYCAKYGG